MKMTDIWYTLEDKMTGESFGAKGKIVFGEDPEEAVLNLKEFVKRALK